MFVIRRVKSTSKGRIYVLFIFFCSINFAGRIKREKEEHARELFC